MFEKTVKWSVGEGRRHSVTTRKTKKKRAVSDFLVSDTALFFLVIRAFIPAVVDLLVSDIRAFIPAVVDLLSKSSKANT